MLEADVMEIEERFLVGYWVDDETFYVITEFNSEGLAYVYTARLNSTNTIH